MLRGILNKFCDRLQDYKYEGYKLSLKDNVNAIKEELSAEEQFLESVIKAEGFWKKYKNIIITLISLVVIAIVANLVMESIKENKLLEANEAYVKVLKDPSDSTALAKLKDSNPALYELFVFQNSIKTDNIEKLNSISGDIKDPVLKDLISYQKASLEQKGLDSYSIKSSSILKNLALLESGFLLLEEGKIEEAKSSLMSIPQNSQLKSVADALIHYSGK